MNIRIVYCDMFTVLMYLTLLKKKRTAVMRQCAVSSLAPSLLALALPVTCFASFLFSSIRYLATYLLSPRRLSYEINHPKSLKKVDKANIDNFACHPPIFLLMKCKDFSRSL